MSDQASTLQRTVFFIPKMDCASEERLVRLALDGARVQRLDFDLARRELTVFHEATPEDLLERLAPLNFGAHVSATSLGLGR